ncbi:MAG: metal-dependent hydrolase [Bacillota bacterium]|nr:metal-dependent hydrolase [Bacillota bacterium]
MLARTHQMFGGTFGLIAILICNLFRIIPKNILEILIFMIFILIGSILPDLDHPKSKLGRKVPIFSHLMYWIFGHRKVTHSLLFVGIVGVGSFLGAFILKWSFFYAFGLTLGVFSHLMGDFLTNSGIPLLYPLEKHYKCPFTFQTSGFIEKIVGLVITLLNLGLLLLMSKTGIVHF